MACFLLWDGEFQAGLLMHMPGWHIQVATVGVANIAGVVSIVFGRYYPLSSHMSQLTGHILRRARFCRAPACAPAIGSWCLVMVCSCHRGHVNGHPGHRYRSYPPWKVPAAVHPGLSACVSGMHLIHILDNNSAYENEKSGLAACFTGIHLRLAVYNAQWGARR